MSDPDRCGRLLLQRTARRSAGIVAFALLVGVFVPVGTQRFQSVATAESGDLPETGLQGQVPLADQLTGRSQLGYRKGLRLVGQNDVMSRGNNFQLAWLGDCAYVGSFDLARLFTSWPRTAPPADLPLVGVAVIDASDPANPALVKILQTPAASHAHEAIEANAERGVLLVSGTGEFLDVYDASADCRDPILKARFHLPLPSHGLRVSHDGMTAYVSQCCFQSNLTNDPFVPELAAIDLTDLTNPGTLLTWFSGEATRGIHDLDLSADGTRAYLANLGGPENGLVILDTTDIQKRRPFPHAPVVGTVAWPNGVAHTMLLARIVGRPYVLTQDETPSYSDACPWSEVRVVDVSDEHHPVVISKVGLEVNDPANCTNTQRDVAIYSPHYSGVDDAGNTTTAFFSWYSSGLRVFDVRDPAHPHEIAYYNPPAKPVALYRGGGYFDPASTWDATTSDVRFRPETGQIWVVSVANGFQILEFSTVD